MLNAIQAGILTSSTKERLEQLEETKRELEARIAEEKMCIRDRGEPAEYDSGVVFGKGEANPDVEEDVQDVSFTFTVEHPTLRSAEQPNLYEAEIAPKVGHFWGVFYEI